jgi:hypothetical protein
MKSETPHSSQLQHTAPKKKSALLVIEERLLVVGRELSLLCDGTR